MSACNCDWSNGPCEHGRPFEAAVSAGADPEPVGPVRIRSANCAAGDHDECASMVEQDVVELGITDCLCTCHVAEAVIQTVAGRGLLDALNRFREWSADPNVKQVLTDMDLCIAAIEAEARSTPAEALDNQHPLIRAIADLPQQAGEPGTDYIKRGGALSVAIEYLRLSPHNREAGE